jgi:protein-S-isoprenylcysteine O-methyltransferase Ste14
MPETTESHFGQWWAFAIFAGLGIIFLLFTPFYKKSQRKPAGTYIAFVVAWAFEMFGIPMSMYILSWIIGKRLPEGILWGHTLFQQFGELGLTLSYAFILLGIGMTALGWRVIYKHYWSKDEGKGELVTGGIYRLIRHPQYTGFMLVTLGMLCDWATLPTLIMWPIMAVIYYRLARKEEADMEQEFGQQYLDYKARTGMFLPRLGLNRPQPKTDLAA